jgi:hypothetical protein
VYVKQLVLVKHSGLCLHKPRLAEGREMMKGSLYLGEALRLLGAYFITEEMKLIDARCYRGMPLA